MMEKTKRYRKPIDHSIRVRLVPELSDMLRTWHVVHGRDWEYMGRTMGLEGLLTGVVAWLMAQPEDMKRKVLAEGLPLGEDFERRWNEKMKKLVDQGKMSVDAKGELRACEPDVIPLPEPSPPPKITLGRPTRPRKGRERKDG